MSKENLETVRVYKDNAYKYLKSTILTEEINPEKVKYKQEKLYSFIKDTLKEYPKNAKMFEIGSADGINAKYISDLGYDITASDIAEDFIESIKEKGLDAIEFNVLEDEFKEKYFAILCWRVFVHFTIEDVEKVLKKVYNALESDGIFIFNAMNAEIRNVEEEWVDFNNEFNMGAKRFYKYFKEELLNEIINKIGFNIKDYHKEGGENNNKWLVYVLKK